MLKRMFVYGFLVGLIVSWFLFGLNKPQEEHITVVVPKHG
jgi:hypothetical protein